MYETTCEASSTTCSVQLYGSVVAPCCRCSISDIAASVAFLTGWQRHKRPRLLKLPILQSLVPHRVGDTAAAAAAAGCSAALGVSRRLRRLPRLSRLSQALLECVAVQACTRQRAWHVRWGIYVHCLIFYSTSQGTPW